MEDSTEVPLLRTDLVNVERLGTMTPVAEGIVKVRQMDYVVNRQRQEMSSFLLN